MRASEPSRLGKRGTLVIPAALRRRFGLTEGSPIIIEATAQGILIRPAVTVPIEMYSRERQAEFLLSNAVDEQDYAHAVAAVRDMGLDPDSIQHRRP